MLETFLLFIHVALLGIDLVTQNVVSAIQIHTPNTNKLFIYKIEVVDIEYDLFLKLIRKVFLEN